MSEKRRILLVEIDPLAIQPKVYATWNAGKSSPNVTLSGGNLVATGNVGVNGCTRATVGMTAGQWYWETPYTTLPSGGSTMEGGIGTDTAALTLTALGFDNPIITQGGPITTSGQCHADSVVTGTIGTVAATNVISHWYDADSGTYQVRKNGGAWQNLGRRPKLSESAWFPMARVANSGVITANFGASPFAYAVPYGVNAGVYSQAAPVAATVYLSSEGFNTGSGDTPASTHYAGRIAGDVDLVTSRQVGCWVWANQTQSSRGQLSIVATDGAIDTWLEWLWRDAEVRIYAGYEGDERGDFVLRSVERVESVKIDERRFTITLADQLALLDRALPRLMYSRSAANAMLAHTPSHVVLGRPLYCEGALRDTSALGIDAFAYDLSDASVRIDAVYDRGDVFTNTPADWAATQDGRGFKLTKDPDEPVVANPAGPFVFAGSDTINAGNGGDFTGWAGSPAVPTGWTQLGTTWNVTNRFQLWNTTETRLRATGAQMVQMYNSGTSLPAGDYRITLSIVTVTTPGVVAFFLGANMHYLRIDRVGAFSVIVTSPPGGAQLQFMAGNDGTNALGAIDVVFITMRARAATVIEHLTDWVEYLASDLGGATVDTAATDALEAVADYRLAHYAQTDETLLSILRRTMDGWCGWLVPKLDGELTVGRLELPAATASLTLTDAHIISVTRTLDTAKGLTTRLAGRRNHRVHADGDIASSVSAALKAELMTEYTIRSAQPSVARVGFSASFVRADTVSKNVQQADGAPAQITFLQEDDDLQSEIGRVGTLERDQHWFYTVECVLAAVISEAIEPRQTIEIVWPRYGLDAGRNLFCIGVTSGFWSRRLKLYFWGE